MNHTRNVEPPIYNARRLNEQPIPPLDVTHSDDIDQWEEEEDWFLSFAGSDKTFGDESIATNSGEHNARKTIDEPLIDEQNNSQGSLNDPLNISVTANNDSLNNSSQDALNSSKNGMRLVTNVQLQNDGQVADKRSDVGSSDQDINRMDETAQSQISVADTEALPNETLLNEPSPNETLLNKPLPKEPLPNEQLPNEPSLENGMNGVNSSNSSMAFQKESSSTQVDQIVEDSTVENNAMTVNREQIVTSVPNFECDRDEMNASLIAEVQNNMEMDNVSPVVAQIKTDLVCLHEMHTGNNSDIDGILEEVEEILYGDDLVMIVGESGLPKPFSMTTDNLIKRENDAMSGNISFDRKVNMIVFV